MKFLGYKSPIGELELVADERALIGIRFRKAKRSNGTNPVLDATIRALDAYFEGKFTRADLPFAWELMPGFQRKVLETLWRLVPAGETVTYKRLAEFAGSPRACRAVGTAMARNPWPIVVPCHRVLATGGIGGFGPGVAVKRRLLAHESAPVPI